MIRNLKNFGYRLARSIPPSVRSPIHRMVRHTKDGYTRLLGQWQGNAVPAYWYRGCLNFGDILTPSLLKHYGFSPYYSHKPLKGGGGEENAIVVVGSILTWLNTEFNGIILGSGAMSNEPKKLPNALFLAVRGELTKQLFQCPDSVILGDPGLLADRLIGQTISKQYRLGIVPHEAEFSKNLFIGKFDTGSDTKIIDPRRMPSDVIRDIAECEYVASSSLHGLITADSLGIPCVRILLSEGLILGGDYKFNDYYSSIDVQHEKFLVTSKVSSDELVAMTNTPSKNVLIQRKNDLHKLFVELKTIREEWMKK